MCATKAISCPACGSSDLIELAWNRRECAYCGTESRLSDDRTRLEMLGWVCPGCGFNNATKTTFCGKCGVALVKICPKCLAEMRSDLEYCSSCGANHDQYRESLMDAMKAGLDKGRVSAHGKQYVEAVLRLNPEDKQALVVRGQVYLQQSHWRQAVSDWSKAYQLDATYAPVREQLDQFIGKNIRVFLTPGLLDDRLKDDRTRHYLKDIRRKSPPPPSPLGETSMSLLRSLWPEKAKRMEEMHEAKLEEYSRICEQIERAQEKTRQALIALAQMCVEGLEEEAKRQRQAEERARQRRAEKARKQEHQRAKQQARDAQRAAAQQGTQPQAAPRQQIVVVEREKRQRRRCCCFPLTLALTLIPLLILALVWLLH
jgi:tetratricopeptide (TPR) repeat protein